MRETSLTTELRHILARYPFARLDVVREFESFRNDNWLVEDDRDRRYVLRRNLQHAEVQRIEFQIAFQQHLLRRGFPAAEFVQTRSGDLLTLDDGGVAWTLCTYVDGREYDFARLEQVLEAARRLAEFHALAESFSREPVVLGYSPPVREWWLYAQENLNELETMFRGCAVEAELTFLREWWGSVLEEWPLARLDALPVGWVYGDYHGRNMVFAGDEMRALFDFDDIDRGPLVYDVAHGALKFGREARGSLRIRPGVARDFIEEYARARPLSHEERAALPMMVTMTFPPNARYYRYCHERRGEDPRERLQREVRIMSALRAEMSRIGSMLPLHGVLEGQ